MIPEKRIEKVHFQITKLCNLRCPFCGQWGEHGFFACANGTPLAFEEWIKLARQLDEKLSQKPTIILWGGKPLFSPFFDKLAESLFDMGFRLEIITNGTMINEHIEVIRRCINKVYVSIDGLKELHDSIRGEGVFDKVTSNLKLLEKEKVRIMTVATPNLEIEDFAQYFKDYRILLQTLIALNDEEIRLYKEWMKNSFDITATEIDSWAGAGYTPETANLPENVTFIPHGNAETFCLSAYRHIHIAWNGNLLYCTDFYDFSAGNIRENSIEELFNNEMSEKYRQEICKGNCPTCNHCSWKNNFEL